MIAFFLIGGIASTGSAAPIELTITGTVSAVLEGGWSNEPLLENDVVIGDAFTATMVLDPSSPNYWYNDPPGDNYVEDRYDWPTSLASVVFSVGGLTGDGPGGNFNYSFRDIFYG